MSDRTRGAEVRQAGELRSARIESLRACAALAVLVGHIYGSAHNYGPAVYATMLHRTVLGGGFAVYLFFALTGYLLYLPFARKLTGSDRPVDYRRYAINRAVRILPLYMAATVVYLILLPHPAGVGTWAWYLLLAENFSRSTIARLDGPAWSLVVEVHFYVLLPFLAALLTSMARRSTKWAALTLFGLGVVSGLVRWTTVLHPRQVDDLWRYNLPATFLFFVPGMLLAIVKASWDDQRPSWLRGPLASGWWWLLGSAATWLLVFDHYRWDPLVCVASFLLLGCCVLPLRPCGAVRALEWRPLAIVGVASYSLYLWHLPIVNQLTAHQLKGQSTLILCSVIVPLMLVIALVSYRLLEEPWLRLRRRWQPFVDRPATV